MPSWILAAALGSVVITAALTWVLWRLNNPPARRESADGGGVWADGGTRRDGDRDGDSGADSGGGDGGGGGD